MVRQDYPLAYPSPDRCTLLRSDCEICFNAPTKWAYDVTYMLYGTLFLIGAAYTLLIDGHVRVDALRSAISPKTTTIIEILCYLIFFFPVIGGLVYFGAGFAQRSWVLAEQAKESVWAPPIYPFKTVLPVAMFLLLIQGIGKFTRCLVFITTGRQL